MIHCCGRCNRLNPPDAVFCYFDGIRLDNASANGDRAAINFGTRPFPSPFVFPSGLRCNNFLQLAATCRRHPPAAIEVLKQGFLEMFFSNLGRRDLALIAKAAAQAPDPDRALDNLLDKLPGSALKPAELQVESLELDLGNLAIGVDHPLELELTNKGDRLITGRAVVEDGNWLGFGENGASEKIIQFFDALTLHLRVSGKKLRSYNKPQRAKILIETNGGIVTVIVQGTVPVKPFPEGNVLAGALSPRQLCKMAKARPKEAIALFEGQAIRQWYQANGWPYPVQGPVASGLAAIEQFFEALGLVQPPKVEVSQSEITLRGRPGERLEAVAIASTLEKRAVVAYGLSDQPWLTVKATVYDGRTASIPVLVEKVPEAPGGTLTARLLVRANGNQRFNLPITLIVANVASPAGADAKTVPQAQAGKLDYRQIYFNAVLGGSGGLVGWLLIAVANLGFLADFGTYTRMIVFGLLLGVCIGCAIGSTEGLIASRSLRRMLKGGGIGAMLGALGGAIGLVLGELIYELAGGGVWPRAIGWAIFGMLVGVSDGFALRMPSKSVTACSAGCSVASSAAARTSGFWAMQGGGDRAVSIAWGSAIGLIIVGACIGALIGLVESLLRKSFLFFFTGRLEGQTRTLDSRRPHTLGSDHTCNIVIPGDPTVQRVHAEIAFRDGAFGIAPREGGVIVRRAGEEQKIVAFFPLTVGDRIQIGDTKMVYRGEEAKKKP